MSITLNEKQQYAYDRIQAGKNVFITGPGGVGKSVLIGRLRDEAGADTILMAPTGIAAQNIQGSTIHRIFQFPFGFITKSARRNISSKAKSLFEGSDIKRIIIDEISMVRADVIAAIDMQLRIIRKTMKPFGGIQMVIVGDFFQLAPILKRNSAEANMLLSEFKSMFAFDTQAWAEGGFEMIYLDQVMRQSDETFVNALNQIRLKKDGYRKALEFLNTEAMKEKEASEAIFLCATNAEADVVNNYYFDEIKEKPFTFKGNVSGSFTEFPVPKVMDLKETARVLVCANNAEVGYFNGQTGVITNIGNKVIRVKLDDGSTVEVEEYKWDEYSYVKQNGKVVKTIVGSYWQMPIKLGYGITIHKSQGMSLNAAVLHTSGKCFAHGQAYVALSRLRSLDGLMMLQPMLASEIIVDPLVSKFYEEVKIREESGMI